MKNEEISRRQFSENDQSWFSKRWACWANNHNGWSKMKKKKYELIEEDLLTTEEGKITHNSLKLSSVIFSYLMR